MQQNSPNRRLVYANLDTAFVSLAALLRYLQDHQFDGRVHVELDQYDAEIILSEGKVQIVREADHATGRRAEGDDALQRLLVRSREPGGLVNVYPNDGEQNDVDWSVAEVPVEEGSETTAESEADNWNELVTVGGELIGTVERAALGTGADFDSVFRSVCLSLGDDYSFLDPAGGRFEYANATIALRIQPNSKAFISGITEALRRVVDEIAKGPRRGRIRERVALELAVLLRRRQRELEKFGLLRQLNRIAGTVVSR